MKSSRFLTKREEKNIPSILSEDDHNIHIWEVGLHRQGGQYNGILSSDEKQRANRYYFEKDRLRYVKTRSVLRMLLSKYLAISPDDIQFQYNQYGKPSLAMRADSTRIWFNVSHSAEYALMAFSWMGEIGIDIEYKKEFPNHKDIAEKFFSSKEKKYLSTLSDSDQLNCFYRLWTRKEAYVKALGVGMSMAFDSFSMLHGNDIFPGEVVPRINGYIVINLELNDKYAAAVAVQGDTLHLTQYKWPWF